MKLHSTQNTLTDLIVFSLTEAIVTNRLCLSSTPSIRVWTFFTSSGPKLAAIAKAGLILPPVRDPVSLPQNVVTDGGAQFERHERDAGSRERKPAAPCDSLTHQPVLPSCTKLS